MPNVSRLWILAFAALATGCSGGTNEPPPVQTGRSPDAAADAMADVVFTNGAVAVRGDTIAYVGDVSSVTALIGDNTEVIDLDGRMLLPVVVADSAGTGADEPAPAMRATEDLLAAVQSAVTVEGSGADGAPQSIDEAIRQHTLEQARALGAEPSGGAIARGMKADLVVLEANLFDVGFADIGATGVQLAMADGRIVHREGV